MKKGETIKEYVLRSVTIDTVGWCWEWRNAARSGYGSANIKNGDGSNRPALAHRVSYEAFVAPIPRGKHLDHLCRNPRCVNPDHLEVVTSRENTIRGRSSDKLKVCKNGHPLTEDNVYEVPLDNGRVRRACVKCRVVRTRESRHRRSPDQIANDKAKMAEAHKRSYAKNSDIAKARAKQWAIDNPERYRERMREWYRKNKERISAEGRARRQQP